jgi:SAM-dependent methyltransferase
MAESTLRTGADTYSSAIETADNYTRWVLDGFRPYFGRRFLEVGLGHGGYRRFLPVDIDYLGLDIDPDCVARAQARSPTERFLVADVTDPQLPSRIADEAPDTVLCVNVLEHIEADAEAVRNLMRVLAPGGHLLIFVPAFPVLYSDLDRMAGHVRRYTRADIPRIVVDGAELLRHRYFNAVGGVGWLANKALRHSSLNASSVNSQIRLFDRFVVPIARTFDLVADRVFGQSMTMVLRKS